MFSELAVVRDLGCWAGCVGREVGPPFQSLFGKVENVKSAIFPINMRKSDFFVVENLGNLGGVQENRVSMRKQLEVSLGTLNTLS